MARFAESIRALTLAIAAMAATGAFTIVARAGDGPASASSTLTIEEAIDTSKRCVLEKNVHLTGSYIESARLERNLRGDRGPYWLITWAWSREVKGGQVFVLVFQSRTCEITYGE